MEALISVIVPAYNAEKTIERCLNSIVHQRYRNLDIIVVNDGSSDGTERIVKTYCAFDSRVRIISIRNHGVSHARNVGIDNAKGDFLTFVDSDDFVDKEMYYSLMQIIKKYNVKIAHCSYKNVDETGKVLSIVGDNNRVVKQNHDEALKCLIKGEMFIGGLCNKLYSCDLFNNCRLDESLRINEDVLINYFLFAKASYSVYIDKPYYNYVTNIYSSTHSVDSITKYKQIIEVSSTILDHSSGKEYEKEAVSRLALNYLGLFQSCVLLKINPNTDSYKDSYEKVLFFKKKGYYNSKKDKLKYIVCRFFPSIYRLFYNAYDKVRKKKLDPLQL